MPAWLSDEWLDRLAGAIPDRPPVPGLTGLVETVIAVGADGPGAGRRPKAKAGRAQKEVRVRVAYKDGQPSWAASGEEADVTFTVPEPEAREILTGEQEVSVGFMRGRIKTSGPPGLVLAWLQSTATPAWAAWREAVQAFTQLS